MIKEIQGEPKGTVLTIYVIVDVNPNFQIDVNIDDYKMNVVLEIVNVVDEVVIMVEVVYDLKVAAVDINVDIIKDHFKNPKDKGNWIDQNLNVDEKISETDVEETFILAEEKAKKDEEETISYKDNRINLETSDPARIVEDEPIDNSVGRTARKKRVEAKVNEQLPLLDILEPNSVV